MHRARRLESNRETELDRAAEDIAARSTPFTIVSGAVAGDDLERVAGAASDALGRPVAIVLPALGGPVAWPPDAIAPQELRGIADYAATMIRSGGEVATQSALVEHAVPIRIGREVVGIVAAASAGPAAGSADQAEDRRAWLEAAAVGAAITTLMRAAQGEDAETSRRALLQALLIGPAADVGALIGNARRLGVDLSGGAMAICAGCQADTEINLPAAHSALLAEVGDGRVLGLVPLVAEEDVKDRAAALASELTAQGMQVALSSLRRDPAVLHDALREAELLLELVSRPGVPLAGQEETYRLLIGVLLRNPEELELLRARTILPLADYDAQHDTELLTTLETFLARHGSTTETAEVMNLHRHTVGYRLARSQEVSGLSPYESDGRERLSLGLKAHQILEAYTRRAQRL